MTIGGSHDWDNAHTGPWLIALALSCAVHAVFGWEAHSFVWQARTWARDILPAEIVSWIPESPPVAPPPPVIRPASRPAVAPRPDVRIPRDVPVTSPTAQQDEPSRNLPATDSAPRTITETQPVGSVSSSPAASQERSIPGAAGSDVTSPSPARLEPVPGPSVAAVPPSASVPVRITQPARPRGGYQVRPAYPAAARQAGAEGTTVLRVHVGTDGTIDDLQVSRSAGHAALDEAAAAAVHRWRFEPARSGSDPVAVWVLIPVEFRIRNEN